MFFKNTKNKIFLVFVLFFLFQHSVSAGELCSANGYTVITINGMIADEDDALYNRKQIERTLLPNYNNQPLVVKYIHNQTHLVGFGDLFDSIRQKLAKKDFVVNSYDLNNMLFDLSNKLKTQKVLFIPHSQGNFYANDIYNKVASKEGGVPKESLGIYGIGSPASYVAGGGKYITSNNDKIINLVRKAGWFLDVLEPNVDIQSSINADNLWGHSLSKIYLKYEGDRIASEIKSSLNKLKNNNVQDPNQPCISAPKLTMAHKILGVFYEVADPVSIGVKEVVLSPFKVGKFITNRIDDVASSLGKTFNGLLANALGSSLENNESILPTEASEVLNTSPTEIVEPQEISPTIIDSELVSGLEPQVEEISPILEKEPSKIPEVISPVEENVSEPVAVLVVINNTVGYNQKSGGSSGSETPEIIPEVIPEEVIEEELEVISEPDITAPVISIIGESNLDIKKGSSYSDAGATAVDDIDGVVVVITEGAVDTSTVGTYTLTYGTTDSSNNVSTLTRTVNVFIPLPSLIINSDTILSAGEYFYDNLIITNNATLTLQGNPLSIDSFKGVKINAKNITVEVGSTISANKQGYKVGPGTSNLPQSGGSYGGNGYSNTDNLVYGSATYPVDLGSGGAGSHNGGGAIQLVVTNTLSNEGVISADGDTNSSGGSIYIDSNKISGSGSFKVNGGRMYSTSIYYMPGSGGRIAIYYKTSIFSGTTEVKGGCGTPSGNTLCAGDGTVGFFDSTNNNLLVNNSWQFRNVDSPFNFNEINLTGGSNVSSENDINISANKIILKEGSHFTLADNKNISVPFIQIDGSSEMILLDEESLITDTLILSGNSSLTVDSEKILSLEISNLTIESGSSISANNKGLIKGPGTFKIYNAGGSYGGVGYQNLPSTIYGSATQPVDFGSGGVAGHHGGGVIRLVITDTLSNEGIISANGDRNSSGGSIYVTAKNITGGGKFISNGGGILSTSVMNAPGGGGRVAVYYENSSFTGTAEAKGGCGSYNGYSQTCAANGTVGFFDSTNNNLLVNSSWQFLKVDSPFNFNNISISNGAKILSEKEVEITVNNFTIDEVSTLTLSGSEITTINNLFLLENSIITVDPEEILSLTVSNLNIESGSSISVDNKGYVKGLGTPDVNYESGSSYGGKGGGVTAKSVYGSNLKPIDFGSGAEANRGGGAIRLIISDVINNDGIISANGNSDRTSGGSIYITTNKINGSGLFRANGGDSRWPYGPVGGGGGRIAIYYRSSSFQGTSTALAGKYCSSSYSLVGENGTIEMIDKSIIPLSSEKEISSFNFTTLTSEVIGTINENDHTISATVPFGTDVTNLVPIISFSNKALINPESNLSQDFTNPITYTITAEDASIQTYIVTITITPDPDPIPDTILPSIINL